MNTTNLGRESRRSRVTEDNSGAWGSSSQDFVRLASLLFERSAIYAKNAGGNCSIYTLAGIPMLFSALRCLLIELHSGMLNATRCDAAVLTKFAESANDVRVIIECYPTLPVDLRENLQLLLDVRHEIVHPAHRPGPEKDNTPTYLSSLRKAGLLQSTDVEIDYIWLSQLQSHRLFRWAFDTIRGTVDVLLRAHNVPSFVTDGILASYSRYETVDADH